MVKSMKKDQSYLPMAISTLVGINQIALKAMDSITGKMDLFIEDNFSLECDTEEEYGR